MPRYLFHVYDGEHRPDEEGTFLPGLDAARLEAARFAGKSVSDRASLHWPHGVWRLTVEDEYGATALR